MMKTLKEVRKDSRDPNKRWERYEWDLKASGAKVELIREVTKVSDSDEYY